MFQSENERYSLILTKTLSVSINSFVRISTKLKIISHLNDCRNYSLNLTLDDKEMYSEILKTWRQEREESSLCSLASDFFLRAQVCFTQMEKKNEYKPFNEKIAHRIQYLLEDLIKIRIKKILSLLTQSPPQTVPLQALTRAEREFVKAFNILFQNLFENQLKNLDTSLDIVSRDENQATTLTLDSSKEEKEEELALIRVVRPIPAFLGTEGLVYGPFAVGDIVNIPRELAYRILIPKGAAVEIETE